MDQTLSIWVFLRNLRFQTGSCRLRVKPFGPLGMDRVDCTRPVSVRIMLNLSQVPPRRFARMRRAFCSLTMLKFASCKFASISFVFYKVAAATNPGPGEVRSGGKGHAELTVAVIDSGSMSLMGQIKSLRAICTRAEPSVREIGSGQIRSVRLATRFTLLKFASCKFASINLAPAKSRRPPIRAPRSSLRSDPSGTALTLNSLSL